MKNQTLKKSQLKSTCLIKIKINNSFSPLRSNSIQFPIISKSFLYYVLLLYRILIFLKKKTFLYGKISDGSFHTWIRFVWFCIISISYTLVYFSLNKSRNNKLLLLFILVRFFFVQFFIPIVSKNTCLTCTTMWLCITSLNSHMPENN